MLLQGTKNKTYTPKNICSSASKDHSDEHHKAFKDPLHVPVGPITKARSKKIKHLMG